MFTKTLLATSVGCVLSLALAAQATAGDTIGFDFDQDGDFDSVESLDWAPGNALAVDAVPLGIGDTFTTYVQGELTSVVLSGGTSVPTPIGAAGPYEITYVIELQESIAAAFDLDGDVIPDLVSFNHDGGTVKLYWDDFSGGINADPLSGNSGLGYDDGTLILSADVIPTLLGASFSITDGSVNAIAAGTVDLDQFAGDSLGGIQTLAGSGDATVDATVNFQDASWFQGSIQLIEFLLNATLENPFDANNPELLVGGNTPFYGLNGINGIWDGDSDSEDFHFEADGNSSFTAQAVPEPGSVALLGLGLSMLGAGQLRRRRRNQA